nr:glycosyltransferase [Conexibacter arvalis]
MLLPASTAAAAPLTVATETVVVPIPVRATSDEPAAPRERVAVAYAPDPRAKGLDLLCAAWAEAALPDARLDVYGIPPESAREFLARRGVTAPRSLRWRGMVPAGEFRAALRSAAAFVSAARWEDYGQAALEAMADGTLPVLSPAGGAYEALPLARALDPALVAADLAPASLAAALRHAFSLPEPAAAGLRVRAAAALRDYAPDRVVARLAADVLPRLLG